MNKQSITFSASEQTLEKLTGDDQFASNTVSYVEATFTLGTNWAGFDSVRAVWKSQHYEISMVLDQYGKCDVPAEVMYYKSKVFVNLVGVSVSGDEITDRLTTYPTLAFTIDSDSAVEGTETTDITPSQFDQFVSQVSDDAAAAAASAADAEAAAASLTVDSALSTSSTNPVQNKVITGAVNDLKEEISEETKNLFTGDYTAFTNMALVNEKVENTDTDTRSYFMCIIRFRNVETNVTVSSAETFNTTGRKSITVTPTGNGTNLYILHNGSARNLAFIIPFTFTANTTYTVSFNLEGCDPRTIGGLVISEIQIETGNEATYYIPHITATDFEVRHRIVETNENILEVASNIEDDINDKTEVVSIYGWADLSLSYASTFDRVISNNIPITVKGDRCKVKWLPNGVNGKSYLLVLRKENGVINTKKTVEVPVVNNQYTEYTFDYDFVGDGTEYIGIVGLRHDTSISGGEYVIYANVYDPAITQYAIPASAYTNSMMAYDFDIITPIKEYVKNITDENATPKIFLNKKIVVLGDSIMADSVCANIIADLTGAMVYNCAIGGTLISYGSDDYNIICGARIAKGIEDGNLANIDVTGLNLSYSNAQHWNTLINIDFTEIDMIVVSYGTNDFAFSQPLDSVTPFDEGSIKTAADYIIKVFNTEYPDIQLCFFTPSYRYRTAWGNDADVTPNTISKYLVDYENAIIESCENNHIPCKSMYYKCGVNKYNYETYLTDGLHRTEKGGILLGHQYAGFLADNVI